MGRVNTSGAEIKAFWDDESVWGKDVEIEVQELVSEVNGKRDEDMDVSALADEDQVTIITSSVYFINDDRHTTIEAMMKKWRSRQRIRHLSVTVDMDELHDLLDAIKAIKSAKVLTYKGRGAAL